MSKNLGKTWGTLFTKQDYIWLNFRTDNKRSVLFCMKWKESLTLKVVKLLSLFSGIGAFEKALKNLNINYELVNYCEIDKYASKAYSVIHGIPESYNLWDVKKIKP